MFAQNIARKQCRQPTPGNIHDLLDCSARLSMVPPDKTADRPGNLGEVWIESESASSA
jgi:hypothetical protein